MNTFELASTILVINGFDVIPASETKEIKKLGRVPIWIMRLKID